MQTPHLIASDKSQGLECWTTWDDGAQVYELWSDSDCIGYVGCADSRLEAIKVAREWFADRASY